MATGMCCCLLISTYHISFFFDDDGDGGGDGDGVKGTCNHSIENALKSPQFPHNIHDRIL